jgi:hypothetical protein
MMLMGCGTGVAVGCAVKVAVGSGVDVRVGVSVGGMEVFVGARVASAAHPVKISETIIKTNKAFLIL